MFRTYTDLRQLKTFEERFEYLKLNGKVGSETFGFDRVFNQKFYKSPEWKMAKQKVIIRDNGGDLGIEDRQIGGNILVHHMNPITLEDIRDGSDFLFNPEYLICVSHQTHNAIHYGDANLLDHDPIERRPYDTCPWRCQNG